MEKGRSVIVLGSTGSVGTQALDVARKEGHKVKAVSANRDVKQVEEQVRFFGCWIRPKPRPVRVCCANGSSIP